MSASRVRIPDDALAALRELPLGSVAELVVWTPPGGGAPEVYLSEAWAAARKADATKLRRRVEGLNEEAWSKLETEHHTAWPAAVRILLAEGTPSGVLAGKLVYKMRYVGFDSFLLTERVMTETWPEWIDVRSLVRRIHLWAVYDSVGSEAAQTLKLHVYKLQHAFLKKPWTVDLLMFYERGLLLVVARVQPRQWRDFYTGMPTDEVLAQISALREDVVKGVEELKMPYLPRGRNAGWWESDVSVRDTTLTYAHHLAPHSPVTCVALDTDSLHHLAVGIPYNTPANQVLETVFTEARDQPTVTRAAMPNAHCTEANFSVTL